MLRIFSSSILLLAAVLFALPIDSTQAQQYSTIYSFTGEDGQGPGADMTLVGSNLYGTSPFGGKHAVGDVFSYNITTGMESLVFSFDGPTYGQEPASSLALIGSTLYGTASQSGPKLDGTVYSYDLTSGVATTLQAFQTNSTDGAGPWAGMTLVGSTLYGTTGGGGANSGGTIFSYDISTGVESVVHSFAGGADGKQPMADLTLVGSTLYGATTAGGVHGDGTIFSYNLTTGVETVLHSFGFLTDGQDPVAGLTVVGSTLYGTTAAGGAYGGGSIFSYDLTTGVEAVLKSFGAGTDGANPQAGLTLLGSALYGTTSQGGTAKGGTVFSYDITTRAETILHSFLGGTDGATPVSGLTLSGSTLYGGTASGGADFYGTLFAVRIPEPSTAVLAVLGGLALSARRRARRSLLSMSTSLKRRLVGSNTR